jgi:hypothetical protein
MSLANSSEVVEAWNVRSKSFEERKDARERNTLQEIGENHHFIHILDEDCDNGASEASSFNRFELVANADNEARRVFGSSQEQKVRVILSEAAVEG